MKIRSFTKLIPLIFLTLLFLLFIYLDLGRFLSLIHLQEKRAILNVWIKNHYFLAPLVFNGICILIFSVAIPAALILAIAAGFLFGFPLGAIYVIFNKTFGASLLFLAVKMALADRLNLKTNKWTFKLQRGFQKNPFLYLLTLRLIPVFPFFIINIVAGSLKVNTRTFIYATVLGGIPCSLIYTFIGNRLGRIVDSNQNSDLNLILSPGFIFTLVILICLCLLPFFIKIGRTDRLRLSKLIRAYSTSKMRLR